MTHRRTPDSRAGSRTRAAVAAAAWFALFMIPACAPKITNVDASYTRLEGQVSPDAHLIVWEDLPVQTAIYIDKGEPDPDAADSLVSTDFVRAYPAGTVRGLIVDNTNASRYEVYRYASNGGLTPIADYVVPPSRKWIGTQTEAYTFADLTPVGSQPGYVGRGLVDGVASPSSPLTNSTNVASSPLGNITASAVWYPPNGKIKLQWDPVPGTARYLVQVYSFRTDLQGLQDQILSGVPAPLFTGKTTDSWVAFVPANVNFLFVADSTRTDIKPIIIRPMIYGSALKVRIAALDAQDRMIALTMGASNFAAAFANGDVGIQRNIRGPGTYELFSLGATTARDTIIVEDPGGPGGGGGN